MNKNQPKVDLTGRVFGKLTVQKYMGKGKWQCICECGNICIIRTGDLNKGQVSCGCKWHEDRFKDLSGLVFGKLTVIKFVEKRGNGRLYPYFLCLCDCGKEVIIRGSHLVDGDIKSCGCLLNKRKGNEYEIKDNLVTIYMHHNKTTVINKDDLDIVSQYTWYLSKQGYVITSSPPKRIFLHRLIMNCPDDLVIDHINHNPADNRRENLRICTQSENIFYRGTNKNNTSGRTGVYENKGKWVVKMMCDGVDYTVGRFDKFEDACIARDEYEIKYFDGFTRKDYNNNVRGELI